MSEKHIGEVVQVIGPVLDIRFAHDELPALLNAIEIESDGAKLTAEVAQQIGDDVVRCIAMIRTVFPTPAPPNRPILPPFAYGQIRSTTLIPVSRISVAGICSS